MRRVLAVLLLMGVLFGTSAVALAARGDIDPFSFTVRPSRERGTINPW